MSGAQNRLRRKYVVASGEQVGWPPGGLHPPTGYVDRLLIQRSPDNTS